MTESSTTVAMMVQDSEFLSNLARSRSFSQNPRWKRHASFDGGATIRSRLSSLVYVHSPTDADSPISYELDEDEKPPLCHVPSAHRVSDFPFLSPSRRPSFLPLSLHGSFSKNVHPIPARYRATLSKRWIVSMFILMVAGALALVLGVLMFVLRLPAHSRTWGIKGFLEQHGIALPYVRAGCENPYREYGHLEVDLEKPEGNRWLPYDPSCKSPELMAMLRSTIPADHLSLALTTPPKPPQRGLALPWLEGKTVLLFGDHIERFHSKDFCALTGGTFTIVDADHALSPPPFANGIDEKFLLDTTNSCFNESRPTLCYLERYDFMIVTAFHFGLANRVEFEKETLIGSKHFYPPVAMKDRLASIVLPLLSSLGRSPDLIEFSSGFWDLRHFMALDEPSQKDSATPLTADRLEWYSDRLTEGLLEVGSLFPGKPLMWRALHHPPLSAAIPTGSARVAALDQLSRKVINNLNRRHSGLYVVPHLVTDTSSTPHRVHPAFKERKSTHAFFLNRVKQRIGKPDQPGQLVRLSDHEKTAGLGHIYVDEWGTLMLGQEHLMNGLHTPVLPGGYLWGDMMLFELRRATLVK